MTYLILAIVLLSIIIIAAIVLWKMRSKKHMNQNSSTNESTLPQEKNTTSPYAKGKEGEKIVASLLASNPQPNQYILNTLKFKYNDINSCQIDHIVINPYGIWVIETKNIKGLIYGTEQDEKWTQVLAYGKYKNFFDNPIKQNAKHITHLANYLEVDNIFHNIVIFLDEANLSNIDAYGVYSIEHLHIALNSQKSIILSNEEIDYYYKILLHLQMKKSTTYKLSLAKPKSLIDLQQENKEQNEHICPKCGGQVVLRSGNFGAFYGCTNYPNCDYTQKCICPQCKSNLILRTKKGHFLGCSNYPKCTYTQKVYYTKKQN